MFLTYGHGHLRVRQPKKLQSVCQTVVEAGSFPIVSLILLPSKPSIHQEIGYMNPSPSSSRQLGILTTSQARVHTPLTALDHSKELSHFVCSPDMKRLKSWRNRSTCAINDRQFHLDTSSNINKMLIYGPPAYHPTIVIQAGIGC